MGEPGRAGNNNLDFCWERVLKSNRQFRVSHLFAPDEFAGQILALHALFASIDQLNSGAGDEFVARQKLEWWRSELRPGNIGKSNHPVLRFLVETGAASSLPVTDLDAFLDTAEVRLAARAPSDHEELEQLCHLIYLPRIQLECALSNQDHQFVGGLREMVQTGGLLQLMRESEARKEGAFWWIPLSTMARHGVSRAGLEEDCDSEPARSVFEDVLGNDIQRDSSRTSRGPDSRGPSPGLVHLQVMALLQARLLGQLRKKIPSSYQLELNKWRVSDLLAAWNAARRFMLQSSAI
jgi:phytoene/squalene synthetase